MSLNVNNLGDVQQATTIPAWWRPKTWVFEGKITIVTYSVYAYVISSFSFLIYLIKTLRFLNQIETKIQKQLKKRKTKPIFQFFTALYFTLVARFDEESIGRDHNLIYVCNNAM